MPTITEHLLRCGAVRFSEPTLILGQTSPFDTHAEVTTDPAVRRASRGAASAAVGVEPHAPKTAGSPVGVPQAPATVEASP